jgi:hypothetical protein
VKEYDFSSIITMKLIVSVTIIVIIFYLLINIFGQRFINILLEVLEIIVYDIYYVFDIRECNSKYYEVVPNGDIGGKVRYEFIVDRRRCNGSRTRSCKYDITGCNGGILVWNYVFSNDSSSEKGAEEKGCSCQFGGGW